MRMLRLEAPFDRRLNYSHAIDFVNVAVERKLEGAAVEAGGEKGWGRKISGSCVKDRRGRRASIHSP